MKYLLFFTILTLAACGKTNKFSNSGTADANALFQEEFVFDPKEKSALADVLLVLDNSSSMTDEIGNFIKSFLSISEEQFPKDTRVAVMSSMAASYLDPTLTELHPWIFKYPGIESEPGYLSFVNLDKINKFLAVLQTEKQTAQIKKYLDAFPLEACTSEWFKPFEKSSKGNRCLEAALQSPLHGVGLEAGLLAFEQLLLKNDKPIFRNGAAVHVIFISDEAHPGAKTGVAVEDNNNPTKRCPTVKELREKIESKTPVTSFRMHGIINPNDTKSGCSLTARITEANGKMVDIQKSSDYSPLIKEVLDGSTPDTPIFTFTKPISSITKVEVDGKKYKDWVFNKEHKTILLQNVDAFKRFNVKVFGN